MSRVDDDTLSLHLEVALATAPSSVLKGLGASDRRRHHAAVGEIVRQLVERLRFFDIRTEEQHRYYGEQALLFPDDLGPMG